MRLTEDQIDEAIAAHVDPIATYRRLHNFARAIEEEANAELERQVHFWKQACDDAHNLGAERLKVATDALEHAEAFVNANVIGNGSGVSCLAHIRRALETLA